MKFHLERRLQLNTAPKYESLYKWAINELDDQGQPEDRDQIPWIWTLRFTATSCLLVDSVEIEPDYRDEDSQAVSYRQAIVIQLCPGYLREDGSYLRRTSYSMFGTSRNIDKLQLDVFPLADDEEEKCTAWGTVSYTSEGADFLDETTPDCLLFRLYVKPETFTRYANKISSGEVGDIFFRAGRVEGLYSDWNPTILTDSVKVLTIGKEHDLNLPPESGFQPPRLGRVGDAALYVNRRLAFAKIKPEVVEEHDEAETVPAVPEVKDLPVSVPPPPKELQSLKNAAWWIVVLLAAILIMVSVR